jgi:thioredoxin-dependent peroxiredoxin
MNETMIEQGSRFPDFSLPDQDGNTVTLDSWKGEKVVVYFYPKDDTPGCTVEACEFRDSSTETLDAKIVGVSPDSPKLHRKFIDKFGLNFTLLADTDHALCEAVGVWVEKSMYGKKYMGVERTTFILNEDGMIAKVFNKVKPEGHAAEVMAALK